MTSQAISRYLNNTTYSFTQNYGYDAANRLQEAHESSNWNQTYLYDAVGNRAVQTPGSSIVVSNATPQAASASTLPFNSSNQWTQSTYDSAGNATAAGGLTTTTYDAENRMTSVLNSVTSQSVSYGYDGDGHRVTSSVNGGTVYVYDPLGNLAAEYATSAVPSFSGTIYLAQDHLGSTRASWDSAGKPVGCHDYLPFGEEVPQVWGRAGIACYGQATDSKLKFTSKERDAETGLDYFGARYFSAAQGRWTSPDWSAVPQPVPYADLTDPQTLNLYSYVRNNPLSRRDPDGHFDCTGKNAEGVACQYIANYNKEHGIVNTAKRSDAPGVPVTLPNGKTVPDQNSPTGLLMAPVADLSDVAKAGKHLKTANDAARRAGDPPTAIVGQQYAVLKENLAHNGNFDYQRVTFAQGNLQQLRQFRDVSNFNVGLLAQQAGMSLNDILTIAGNFAKSNSSNYDPNQPYGLDPQTRDFTTLGYQTGESGVYGK